MLPLFRAVVKFYITNRLFTHHNYIQNDKDRFQVRVYTINKEIMTHFSQFTSIKVMKILGKSQAQFREKLRKPRLRQNDAILIKNIKNTCNYCEKITR